MDHNIYTDTCLHPGTIANMVCAKLHAPQTIAVRLEEKACVQYKTDPEFRMKMRACTVKNPAEGDPEKAWAWITDQMTEWAKEMLTQKLGLTESQRAAVGALEYLAEQVSHRVSADELAAHSNEVIRTQKIPGKFETTTFGSIRYVPS